MGALNAYAISEILNRPALLFNPPLIKYNELETSRKFTRSSSSKQVVLGGNDDVVNPAGTLNYLGENLQQSELNIKVLPKLGHQIPLDIFTIQVKKFIKNNCA